MELPDILKGLDSIGSWELYWWGSRWELTNEEVERAVSKIDVERNKAAIVGAGVTIAATVLMSPLGGGVAGGATAAVIGLYELLKSRIKSVNQGRGVIVDFAFDYSKGDPIRRFIVPRFSPNTVRLHASHSLL